MSKDPLRFSLRREEISVFLSDPNNEEEKEYILREMDGDERDAYLNSLEGRMKQKGKEMRVARFDGFQVSLIRRCLYHSGVDGKLVEEKEIRAYPSSVQNALFDEAHKLCGLGTDSEDDSREE